MEIKSKAIETREPVVVKVSEFKGKDRLDIRHHYVDGDSLSFTKKGVNIPLIYADDLVMAVTMVYEHANREGDKARAVEVGRGQENPVVVCLSEYGGKMSLDIRHYWTPEGKSHPVATRKGVNIPFELAFDFVSELQKVVHQAKEASTITVQPVEDGRFAKVEI